MEKRKKELYLLKGHVADPKAALDPMGKKLVDVMTKQAEARMLVEELWKRYLRDCARYKVTPIKRS